jgi:hypothetical protein
MLVNQTGLPGLVLTRSYSPTTLTLLASALHSGDANLDGQVDVADLGILASNWQISADWLGADFDGSGFVDVADLGILASNWQAGVGSPLGPSLQDALMNLGLGSSSVPEPAGIALLLGTAALSCRRRQITS